MKPKNNQSIFKLQQRINDLQSEVDKLNLSINNEKKSNSRINNDNKLLKFVAWVIIIFCTIFVLITDAHYVIHNKNVALIQNQVPLLLFVLGIAIGKIK